MSEHSADYDRRCFAEWNDRNSVRVHICTKQGAHTTHRCGACGETANKVIPSAEGGA